MRERMTYEHFGLGCWRYGLAAPGSPEEKTALEIIGEAYARGVRHFDTAQGYGNGRSEAIVGTALRGKPDAEIATKSQLADSAEQTAKIVDKSLGRIERDAIELFYIHWPRQGHDPRPMLEALETERARGRVRRIGVSNFAPEDLRHGSEVAKIDVHQIGYSLLWRYPENEVIPYCREAGIEFYSYSSLAQGLLTGKMPERPRFEPGDPRPATVFYDDEVWPHVYRAVTRMKVAAEREGVSLHHAALRWLIEEGGVQRVLVGARTVDQLDDNLATFGTKPSPALLDELRSISDEAHARIPDIGNIFKHYP